MEEHFEIGDLVVYVLADGVSYIGTITYVGNDFYTVDTYNGKISKNGVYPAKLPFKKGDTVRVKNNLKPGIKYGRITFQESMKSIRGTVTTITKVSKTGTYYLKNSNGFTLSKEMLEFPVKVNDVVLVTNYTRHPTLGGNIYSVSKVSNDGYYITLNNGIIVSVADIEVTEVIPALDFDIATVNETCNTINKLNSLENENQLQRKGTSLIRGEHPEGSRVYGRRPKAAVSIRPLSNKARAGYSQG